ncbi:uncharacterized protein LOC112603261 [Melanaphis sacchari]|uniref:uncharacterized protein LOC112603261 n=1 Tax=Melanaphis sacchari TaxID=742174 RepID=UPI000DC15880|nr:uncharacterized protein LOC112603261 [Melanaphis sacchari]XP_025207546.1 uncharacterized protein LOC112603261 [Melanaphis sacchari]XP_025207547.1 uncharacterized protein LOC112603261 [Melanaphis sacchari]
MALKIWTFLLVMSLPAAERGRGFGSLAATVLGNIDYYQMQQKLFGINSISDGDDLITRPVAQPPIPWPTGHRVDKRAAPKITNKNPYAAAASSTAPLADGRCMARVQSALGDMMSAATGAKNGNRRHTAVPPQSLPPGFMDLSGYALHQRLRTAPGAEMYVTGMRAKVMPPRDAAAAASESLPNGADGVLGDRTWARVDECRYDPLGNTLEARMRFGRTLMVSGSVRLLYGGGGGGVGGVGGETGCDMTLRLRPRAGLGFTAAPLTVPEKSPPNRLTAMPTMTIRTTATFIDPEPADDPAGAYVSVHSYNCVGGAAGFPGNRERPVAAAASSDRYEQFLSSELGSDTSNELLQSAGSDESDADDGAGSAEFSGFGDERSGRRPSSPSSSSSSSSGETTTPANSSPPVSADLPYVSAGFVNPPAPSPEPRLHRIQYHNKLPPQHPLLTISSATVPAANNPHHQQVQDQLLMEMEDVFVRGVRSLLAKHMERTLKPVLKDSLMANMGYTVSYG